MMKCSLLGIVFGMVACAGASDPPVQSTAQSTVSAETIAAQTCEEALAADHDLMQKQLRAATTQKFVQCGHDEALFERLAALDSSILPKLANEGYPLVDKVGQYLKTHQGTNPSRR